MKLLLEKRNTIYGMCALWIVLFHIFRRIGMPYIPIVTNIVGIGNIGVDIFVFLSGLCLSLSAEKRKEFQLHVSERTRDFFWGVQATALFNYYKRRFKRILVPYFLICIPYYLWYAMFEKHGSIMRRGVIFVANLTSAAFWIKGTQTTWYVYGILIFYLLFPLLYMVIRRGSRLKIISLMAGLICFAIITAYTPNSYQ